MSTYVQDGAAAAAPATTEARSTARKAALAALVGTAIEYYEFGIYGYMAATIGPLFFPSTDPTASLLAILAVFGSAFVMRPIGGIVLGRLGDRIGRKGILLVTVIGMGIATAAIGMLPVTASIGLAAPVLLVLIRLIQGFFAGGEVTGAAAYAVESAPAGKRGYYGAFTPVGVAIGGAVAAITCGSVSALLSPQEMQDYGWRIPFLLAIPMVIISALVRRRIEESAAFKNFQAHNEPPKAPLREVLTKYRAEVVKVTILAFGQNVGYWVGLVFMNIYLTTYQKFDKTSVYWLMAAVSLTMAVLMPMFGALSDRLGRRKVLGLGFVGYMLLVLPMMMMMSQGSFMLAAIGMFLIALPLPVVQSVGYPTYAEQFPTRVRYTGMAFSFNIGAILGGGVTPYLATSLIAQTGNLQSPAYLLIGAAVVSLLALLALRETSRTKLD